VSGRFVVCTVAVAAAAVAGAQQPARWTAVQANNWYDQQPWLVGANYIPANAINQLEMWQRETFDPSRIDRELAWAAGIGMNTVRVFLHNLLWEQDSAGFVGRIDRFLQIASSHHIRVILVLFDSCWDPDPHPGPQHPPVPGVHNSGWVQSPGYARLGDAARYPSLAAYVEGVVGTFGHDPRVIAWDVWTEPDAGMGEAREPHKVEWVARLLPSAFTWARDRHPSQPLTSGLSHGEHDWSNPHELDRIEKIQLADSDVLSFHNYDWPETFAAKIGQLSAYGRPILCTEYMARGNGSTFDGSLPIGKRHNVAMINWGLVTGKTQTRFPWDSWQRPYTSSEPAIWFHDVLRADGTPYRRREVELIKALSAAPKGVAPVPAE
jgi:hypothetical protein